ncbi:MAG TPA: hypothetical protein DCZ69_00370 [Syntrophobacteraceae bacterium]|nr:hypothetical protein [Syntrophobacteraceae bacterium]
MVTMSTKETKRGSPPQGYSIWLTLVGQATDGVVTFLKCREGLDVYDYDSNFNPLLIGRNPARG